MNLVVRRIFPTVRKRVRVDKSADYGLLLLFPTVIILHLYVAPYTKVEESFNIQAIHDIIRYGVPLRNAKQFFQEHYDHVGFPGSVPRTFIGALVLAESTLPFAGWVKQMGNLQTVARGILGLFNAAALWSFTGAVNQAYGKTASYWYILLQVSQFHVMYYASRTLPNMFAFGFTTLSLRFLITSSFGNWTKRANQTRLSLYLLTLAGVVFRSELAILVATTATSLLFLRRSSLWTVIVPAGMTAAAVGLGASVIIDSFFWQQAPLWPEWVAFRYNAIEGKSADWGVSPWHYYFSNALPRLMLNPISFLVCIPTAFAMKFTRKFSVGLLVPLLGFVTVYSILPHKEWRFILYVIPGFTAVASAGASWIWTRRSKSVLFALLSVALVVSVLFSFAMSMGQLYISSLSYPGAVALNRLHQLAATSDKSSINVHLDNLSCQTGVTRFLQKPRFDGHPSAAGQTVWSYDKTEDEAMLADPAFWAKFDYVLGEQQQQQQPMELPGRWDVIDRISGFAGFRVVDYSSSSDGAPRRFDRSAARAQLVMLKSHTDLQIEALLLWKQFEYLMRRYVTRGRWVAMKMEPRIVIFRNASK